MMYKKISATNRNIFPNYLKINQDESKDTYANSFNMSKLHNVSLAGLFTSSRILPCLLVLLIGSGCAALIYEIVWFQMLQLLIGSSAVSLGVLLGTYMGGMCLGSLALPRLISPRRHPLRVYASLEVGIGIIGVAILLGMPLIDKFYVAVGGNGFSGILLRGAICAVCLLPPTMLMGATLPAIARWLKTTPHGVSWIGFFYGGNIAGAVFGCLLAGFYLLKVHDVSVATYTAASVNGSIALIAFGLAALTPYVLPEGGPAKGSAERVPGSWAVYVAIGLSGMCALGAEVTWTRLLSLILGGTVYTFAIILAVFLMGLGIGSYAGSILARKIGQPRAAFGWCQMLLAAAIAWTSVAAARILPYWQIDTSSLSTNPWLAFQLDLSRCLLSVLPPTLLWGASFPLALAAAASRRQDPGRLVGGIYAANTIGAIAGSIGFSMFFIPHIGTQQSQRLLIVLCTAAGLLLLAPLVQFFRTSRIETESWKPAQGIAGVVFLVAASGLAVLLTLGVAKIPWELVAFGRRLPTKLGEADLLFVAEGINSSIAVTETGRGVRSFHVSGKIVASSNTQDMRLQRMLGHIPALLHPKPRSVLVVGCGAGVTAGSFLLYPSVERIVICEIEPIIPPTAFFYFGPENNFVMEDPAVEVVIDDARHYILKTREKFDIITSDPIHPWIKGSAALYSKEYFELCREHLNPGGLITQWVPLYQSTPGTVKSEMATFLDVFPNGTIWSNDLIGMGYDVVLLGQVGPLKIDVDGLEQRLGRADHLSAAQSLKDVGFQTAVDLLATYTGRGPDLKPWLKDAQINRDRNLRLQYLAGMGLNVKMSQFIFSELSSHFQFPEDLFIASEPLRQSLRKAFGQEK
jgi:spermidine synthase